MKKVIPLIIILLTSCGSLKEFRIKRAENKIERLTIKFPELIAKDTLIVYDTVQLITERIEHDTSFILSTDTIEIVKDKLRVKYYVKDSVVNINAACESDTVKVVNEIKVPYEKIVVNNKVPWWVYLSLVFNLFSVAFFISRKFL